LSAAVSGPGDAGGIVGAVLRTVYTRRLGGRLTPVGPGELEALLSGDGDAILDARLSFADERRFGMDGEIRFGAADSLRFRTLETGRLDDVPPPGIRHGVAVLEVCGGTGRFAGACGRITSNFVVSDDGEITEHQLGVVFTAEPDREER
jgi:hypothetical protein